MRSHTITNRDDCRRKFTIRKEAKLLPKANVEFRVEFEKGLADAWVKIDDLRRQGWEVDDKASLMVNQADRLAENLERKGFETMRLPIAKWLGEEMQFVAYKSRSGTKHKKQTKVQALRTSVFPEKLDSQDQGVTFHKCFRCRKSLPRKVYETFESHENASHDLWLLRGGWLEVFVDPILTDDDEANFLYVCPACLKSLKVFLKA